MIKYIGALSAVIFSLSVYLLFFEIRRSDTVVRSGFPQPESTVLEAELYFSSYFDQAPLVSTFDEGIAVLEFLSLTTSDTLALINKIQKIDTFRLHSVSIIPSNDENTYDVLVTYASS